MSRPFKDFKGNIDALLEHCARIDPNMVEDEDVILNRDEMIDVVAEELHCSKEEAAKHVTAIQMEELHRICKDLVELGLLEVTGYDDDGPTYGPTEKAKKYLRQEGNQTST